MNRYTFNLWRRIQARGSPSITTLHHTATHRNTPQHTAAHCSTLQHTAAHCSTLQHTATHRNTLQHTAAHCNTLQHTATHCNTPGSPISTTLMCTDSAHDIYNSTHEVYSSLLIVTNMSRLIRILMWFAISTWCYPVLLVNVYRFYSWHLQLCALTLLIFTHHKDHKHEFLLFVNIMSRLIRIHMWFTIVCIILTHLYSS